MRFAVLVMILLAGTAFADGPKQPFSGITIGTDGQVAASPFLMQQDISPRIEVSPAPHQALVLRGGVGRATLVEGEVDLPDYYSHRHAAVGYRVIAEHAYLGLEVGREWFLAHGGEDPPMQGYTWFAHNVVNMVVGAKLGPVDVGVDVEPRGRIGVHVGVDLVRFSL